MGGSPIRIGEVQKNTPLGELPTGTVIRIAENGVLADFKVAQHNYVQPNVTAVERVLCLADAVVFNSTGVNTYEDGDLDTFLTTTYLNRLEQKARDSRVTVYIAVTPGNGNSNVITIGRNIFVFSGTELGLSADFLPVEGSRVEIYSDDASRVKYGNNDPTVVHSYWSRSMDTRSTANAIRIYGNGNFGGQNVIGLFYIAPVISLSSSTLISPNMTIA